MVGRIIVSDEWCRRWPDKSGRGVLTVELEDMWEVRVELVATVVVVGVVGVGVRLCAEWKPVKTDQVVADPYLKNFADI